MPDPDRVLIGHIAANERWARADADTRRAGTQAARDRLAAMFEEQVDPAGTLDPEERARRARNARRAHMARLARKSAEVRRERAAERRQAEDAAELAEVERVAADLA